MYAFIRWQVEDNMVTSFFSWLRHVACGFLAPRPEMEPSSTVLDVQSLNHCTTKPSHFGFLFLRPFLEVVFSILLFSALF